MEDLELLLNLWYLYDETGLIYSLRVRLYVASGSDDEKLRLLRQFAPVDYLIAQPFPIPERFHITTMGASGVQERLAVAHVDALRVLNSETAIFEDALQAIEAQLPAQTTLRIPPDPLVCLTPLLCTDDGRMIPQIGPTPRQF